MNNTPTVETANHSPLSPPVVDTSAELPRLVAQALSRHCRRYRCSPDDRADLAQDAYVAALTAHSSYDPAAAASHSTWVLRRVQGQLVDSTRKLRSRGMTHLPLEIKYLAPIVDAQQGDDEDTPAWDVAVEDDAETLWLA